MLGNNASLKSAPTQVININDTGENNSLPSGLVLIGGQRLGQRMFGGFVGDNESEEVYVRPSKNLLCQSVSNRIRWEQIYATLR